MHEIVLRSEYFLVIRMRLHPGIRIDKIPAKGVAGLIFTLAMLAILFVGVPACRWLLLFSVPVGLIIGAPLYLWHRRSRG
jgi:hypothetical protein